MKVEELWLQYFNPCGAEIIAGYGNRSCVSEKCGQAPCLRRAAYIAAEAMLSGSNISDERRELNDYFNELIGKEIIKTQGNSSEVVGDEVDELTDDVLGLANRYIDGVESCMRSTIQISQRVMRSLSNDQRLVLERFYDLNQKAVVYQGGVEGARDLAGLMQKQLDQALSLDLGHISLVARQALAYGLADKLSFIDATGLIFIGDPSNIRPLR